MKRALFWLSALVLASVPSRAASQKDPFLEKAREGTFRYRDVRIALADGFRPLGPDAPGMGRHYVNVGRVLADTVDVAHPPVLAYAAVGDSLMLVAVAYVVPVRPGSSLPSSGLDASNWHFHYGDVGEEGHLFGHEMMVGDRASGSGVAMLHAWVWLDNPAGPFAPDNWLLPFFRRGLETAAAPSPEAAKALELLAGDGRFMLAHTTRGQVDPSGFQSLIDQVRRKYTAPNQPWLQLVLSGTLVTAEDLRKLERIWRDFERDVAGITGRHAGPH